MILLRPQLNTAHPRASAILTTIFLLFGIFVVSMIGIEIIMNGLAARRAQGASSKAFYAAESGAERAINLFKIDSARMLTNCPSSGQYIKFSDLDAGTPKLPKCNAVQTGSVEEMLGDSVNNTQPPQPKYWVKQRITNRIVGLNARGNYANTSRELYISFCLPDCTGGSGSADGCGGTCQ